MGSDPQTEVAAEIFQVSCVRNNQYSTQDGRAVVHRTRQDNVLLEVQSGP
jgi:hypothetical protein